MGREARRPNLRIQLAAWASGGSNSSGSGGGLNISGSGGGSGGGGGSTATSPARPPRAKRMWVLPLGSTLSWCNDLTCAVVRVRVRLWSGLGQGQG